MDAKEWYSQSMVLWELSKQLQYKYLSIRKPNPDVPSKSILTRYLLGYKPELIIKSIENYGGFNENIKLYFDVPYWKETPMFSFDPNKRSEQKERFTADWKRNFNGYDFIIDIDFTGGMMKAYKYAKPVKEFFDRMKVPYSVKPSGTKGWHFIIPHRYLPAQKDITLLPIKCCSLAVWIANRFNIPITDEDNKDGIDSAVYLHTQILKLAYSLDHGNVSLPLTDYQFDTFSEDFIKVDNVIDTIKIFKRGSLIRTHGLPDDQLKKNVKLLFSKKEK